MSNIDKQAVQAVADLKAGYTLGHADVAILNELARIALASLEAEAVCVIDQSNLDYLKSGADADVWPASRKEMGDVLLYRTAPPAPVYVPAAMEMDDDFDSSFEHGKAVGWNAYRAAMLQSFGNSEQLNSPVIQDGWVACVERMPSAGEQVLAYRPDAPESNDPLIKMATYVGGSAHGHGFDCYCKPTHWMPLPAEPQQEVTQALAKGMERYGDAMQKLADSGD
ncbi:DUF551 domain-containing protein [Enterobacter roggenkampii]|uniref:Protein of uncharacterized function (DUF551) n=1 Tax=Enterobacter roggenkampii TaxID=1812935 RepID=A0ABY0IZD7_9ENTR|nr:DUF551 domain-containing protein [Enterobacter roggenkampii]SAA27909.1 Protein of uncharacterised function (DUF551) [Enterobacter roggenkampii]